MPRLINHTYTTHRFRNALLCAVIRLRIGLIALTLLTANTFANENSDYTYCTVCHGTNGNGNRILEAPKISGMEPWYIESQLNAFRSGFRGIHHNDETGNEMLGVTRMLKDENALTEAVNYISKLESKITDRSVQGNDNRGKTLYATCSACHGTRAEGNQVLHSPALVQQSDWYLVSQINKYRNGLRGTHKDDVWGSQMLPMALALPDEKAINDVVAYIKSLE